ncbi:MAG: DUF1080 domain-containing protein, partial [Acidobacteriaceae bacterium]|nr:DUF1080 domain-containing protein [Acidobacteriaceae bacterium]
FALTAALVGVGLSRQTNDGSESFAGRWDLTLRTPDQTYPSWIEVTQNGSAPSVRIVGRVASVHPARNVRIQGAHLLFSSMESFGKQIPVDWDLRVDEGKLSGVEKRSDGVEGQIRGVPAPRLDRPAPAAWSDPEALFDGKDLAGWQPDDPGKNHWTVENGELVNQAAGANIRSDRKFEDFKLHIEYNCPNDGNSGVYLRGRYEVQVEYEAADKNDKFHMMGSIYGFIPPAQTVAARPGQWESYDILLIGRTVTVVRDDVKIIDAQEIPGITGGALDSDEGAPGPIYIQGDHTGGMKYRNIRISVPAR